VRVVTISPQGDEVPTDDYVSLGQFYLSHLTGGGGAVRWHLLKGYQWVVRDFWAHGGEMSPKVPGTEVSTLRPQPKQLPKRNSGARTCRSIGCRWLRERLS
jgi:hypothetical protein